MRGPTFVVPGRIAEQKNQLAVLRAVGRLRSEKAWPDNARVILAGRVESHTDYAGHVDRAVSELRLGSIVRRIEPVSDVEALLAAADATLLPSLYEGLPNAVLESLACATPVVVSSAANRDALVRHGVSGVVTAADDWSIAAAMRSVLAMPGEARVAMGRAGREDVLARFGIARMVDATCAVYERVTA
jgi:glycosyltransferase involved in cell wall biosynthesis